MSQEPTDPITRLLQASSTDRAAADELLKLVYDELHRIAERRMAGENPGSTLQATVLVHDAYLKLVGDREVSWSDRGQFFSAAVQAMREIVIDHARARQTLKRGGKWKRVALGQLDLGVEQNFDEILALDDALSRFKSEDPEAAHIVELRFFVGLSVDEIAEVIAKSPRHVDRRWQFARAWLFRAIGGG